MAEAALATIEEPTVETEPTATETAKVFVLPTDITLLEEAYCTCLTNNPETDFSFKTVLESMGLPLKDCRSIFIAGFGDEMLFKINGGKALSTFIENNNGSDFRLVGEVDGTYEANDSYYADIAISKEMLDFEKVSEIIAHIKKSLEKAEAVEL